MNLTKAEVKGLVGVLSDSLNRERCFKTDNGENYCHHCAIEAQITMLCEKEELNLKWLARFFEATTVDMYDVFLLENLRIQQFASDVPVEVSRAVVKYVLADAGEDAAKAFNDANRQLREVSCNGKG